MIMARWTGEGKTSRSVKPGRKRLINWANKRDETKKKLGRKRGVGKHGCVWRMRVQTKKICAKKRMVVEWATRRDVAGLKK